jgi:hypothetical protein
MDAIYIMTDTNNVEELRVGHRATHTKYLYT